MESRNDFRSSLSHMSQALNTQHHVGGVPADEEGNRLITQFLTAWFYLASDVLSQCDIPEQSMKARLHNFVEAVTLLDLSDVLNICQDAADLLIGINVSSYNDFKGQLLKQHPVPEILLSRLLAPASLFLVALFECPDVKAVSLQQILSFFRYGKKLDLRTTGLEEQAILAYLDTETLLDSIRLEDASELVSGLNQIMRCWLRELNLHDLIPQHGNGSVAEGKLTLYDKYKNLQIDLYLKIVLGPCWYEFFPCGCKGELTRVSRTIFVPKTFSKLRTISMEPVTLQYFQQGVMKKLYSFIEDHSYLSRRIKLRDQTQNQQMAKQGSIDNSLSTIDLKAASDSVSWDLVKAVFAGTPLLKWLYATRSKKTKLPTGEIIVLRKFAPMGSALCFPVECLIFAAVIEYVTQKWCRTGNRVKPNFSVFGDDLIVASELTHDVILALESIGFTVNRSKSFTDGPFRESCGGDYYEGIDVSSVYYRLGAYNDKQLSPEVYSAMCSACNICAERGLHLLRSYLLGMLLPRSPYFTSTMTKSPQLYSPYPTNFHASRRWSKEYQLWLGRFCTVLSKPLSRKVDDGDDVAYFVKLAEMAMRKSHEPFSERVIGISLHGSRVLLGCVEHEVDSSSNADHAHVESLTD